jgi:hypothetical protein
VTQQPFLEAEGDASGEAHVDAPVPPLVEAAMSSGEGVVPDWSGGFARVAGSATALAPSEASPSAPRGGGARFAHWRGLARARSVSALRVRARISALDLWWGTGSTPRRFPRMVIHTRLFALSVWP